MMSRMLETYLVALTIATLSAVVCAQSGVTPLQRGVSVEQPVTSNAAAVPQADKQDAPVVTLTADGSVYLAGNRISAPALADRLKALFSTRDEKTLYIKADARVPYARLVEVIDGYGNPVFEGVTLLPAQRDASDQRSVPVPPQGLAMRVVQP